MVDKLGDWGHAGAEGEPLRAVVPGEADGGCEVDEGSDSERPVVKRDRICADAAFFEEHRERLQAIIGPYRLYKLGEETIEQLMVTK